MCGIHLTTLADHGTLADAIDEMLMVAAYRGPDSVGTFVDNKVAMGINRLDIVGGQQGAQPITIRSAELVLIGNGEIFNYRELDEGFTYSTTSDLEVILHLYEKYDLKFVERLEGQFSFVLYDTTKNKIIFARDRWGITPLFYSLRDGLILSSSIKALARVMPSPIKLNPQALAQQWCLYGATPPETIFRDIYQLPPGGMAVYDLTMGLLDVSRFVKPNLVQMADRVVTPVHLKDALTRSVRKRLQGGYGPGVYVSGGVDSSIIASLVARSANRRPILFSITFSDPRYDESLYQKQVAAYLGCELKSVNIDISDIIENMDACIKFTESPLIRSAPVPMMLLSGLVRSCGIKYVLCGEGADELFAGYPVFQKHVSSVIDKREEMASFAKYFEDPSTFEGVGRELKDFAAHSSLSDLRQDEIDTKLSRYLLTNQGDRVAMANGVEQRFPFLDAEVSQCAFAMSPEQLIHDGEGKYLLREAFKDSLPRALLYRKKQGYLTPDIEVATTLQKMSTTKDLLSEERCRRYGVFNYLAVNDLFGQINTDAKARFLIFVYSTHRLMENLTRE